MSWKASTQKTPTLSSTESEMVAAVLGASETLYCCNVLKELGDMEETKYKIRCDNEATCKICRSQTYKGRVKHIDTKYHFLRHQHTAGKAEIKEVKTSENPADILTKPLAKKLHQKHARPVSSNPSGFEEPGMPRLVGGCDKYHKEESPDPAGDS